MAHVHEAKARNSLRLRCCSRPHHSILHSCDLRLGAAALWCTGIPVASVAIALDHHFQICLRGGFFLPSGIDGLDPDLTPGISHLLKSGLKTHTTSYGFIFPASPINAPCRFPRFLPCTMRAMAGEPVGPTLSVTMETRNSKGLKGLRLDGGQ